MSVYCVVFFALLYLCAGQVYESRALGSSVGTRDALGSVFFFSAGWGGAVLEIFGSRAAIFPWAGAGRASLLRTCS